LRFGLFAYGNPGDGLWMIIMSCVSMVWRLTFFISGSLFIETTTDFRIRSAQGLFMMMSNGFGAFFGGIFSGLLITFHDGVRDWHNIWLSFGVCLVIALLLRCCLNTNIMQRMLL
jgi:NHS family xanthosine MFS transporter